MRALHEDPAGHAAIIKGFPANPRTPSAFKPFP
jgi:hypothetical protein